jgi:hypothetical protein
MTDDAAEALVCLDPMESSLEADPCFPPEPAPTPASETDTPAEVVVPTEQAGQELAVMREQSEVEVPEVLIDNIDRIIANSIVSKTGTSDYIALKDGITIADNATTPFQVNTEVDPLKIRSETGSVVTEVPKNAEVEAIGGFKIFIPASSPNTKILMIKVKYNQHEGYAAAPYLKLPSADQTTPPAVADDTPASPATPPVVASPSSRVEAVAGSTEILATNMSQVSGIGDSLGVGMKSAGFSRMHAEGGRRTSGHLSALRSLIASGTINSTNTKSFILYGAGNNFSATRYRPENVTRAISDFEEMVVLLKNAGIQPVVCTMIESISDRSSEVSALSPDQRRDHPRMQSLRGFNNGIRELATRHNIPLVDMHSLPNPGLGIHPGRDFYRQMVDLIESSLADA